MMDILQEHWVDIHESILDGFHLGDHQYSAGAYSGSAQQNRADKHGESFSKWMSEASCKMREQKDDSYLEGRGDKSSLLSASSGEGDASFCVARVPIGR
jgi:hypothetical protein